jgi:hypothetical protein
MQDIDLDTAQMPFFHKDLSLHIYEHSHFSPAHTSSLSPDKY